MSLVIARGLPCPPYQAQNTPDSYPDSMEASCPCHGFYRAFPFVVLTLDIHVATVWDGRFGCASLVAIFLFDTPSHSCIVFCPVCCQFPLCYEFPLCWPFAMPSYSLVLCVSPGFQLLSDSPCFCLGRLHQPWGIGYLLVNSSLSGRRTTIPS
jgi:hypothetical protein